MKHFIILIASFSLFGCNKYLDKPGDPTKKVPQTVADVQMLLDQPLSNGCTFIGADEFYISESNSWILNGANKNFYFNWILNTDIQMLSRSLWKEPYQAVFNTNVALEILNKIPVTANNKLRWEQAKGIAHFTRAFSFLTIAWEFAQAWDEEKSKTDLGAVLDLDSDFLNKLSRSTVAQTYDQILADAQEAVKYLPPYTENPLRPSKIAAYGLLARIYLSMRKYDKALEQCDLYLSKATALLDYNNPADVDLNSEMPFRYLNKEVLFHNASVLNSAFPNDFYSLAVDTNIVKSFHDNDLRKTAYFEFNGEYYQFTGDYLGDFMSMTGVCTDEMFLTRAECLARAGETNKAMRDLNDLLITRWQSGTFIPFTANTKEEALDIILQERKKELLFRGLRWMDIKRLNKEGANISIVRKSPDLSETGTLLPGSPRFAMQLPTEIVFNFGYEQNPIE